MEAEPRDTLRGNPLQVAVARLMTDYELVNVNYPVEVWVPRTSMKRLVRDWPMQTVKEQPLSIRLPEIGPLESDVQSRYAVGPMKLDLAVSPNELRLNLMLTRVEVVDPLQAIREARKEA